MPRATSTREHLGARVATARKRQQLTQADFAKIAGVSVRSVANVEAGRKVSASTLRMVDTALGWPAGHAEAILRGDAGTDPIGTSPTDDEFVRHAIKLLPDVLTYFGEDIYEQASARITQMLHERRGHSDEQQ